MTDIATFLLARIAEQEKEAEDFQYLDISWIDVHGMSERWLAECKAKREIIAEVQSWPHYFNDDFWYYSCSQAVPTGFDGEPGSGCANASRSGKPCDCGLDARRTAILQSMAQPDADHPDFDPEWA